MDLVDKVNKDHNNKSVEKMPYFKSGDTIAVHAKIKEGNKVRIQIFQGVCIAVKKRNDMGGHFCVRKISGGMGVERVFPFHSPNVEKVVIKARGKTRRAKLYYLRKRSGKSAHVAIDYDRKI